MTTRQEWNKLATEKTSEIVGAAVEVVLTKNNQFSIYSEVPNAAESAMSHYTHTGATVESFAHYEADEDGPECWVYEMKIN